jgi:hypothetical protein
MHEQFSLGAAGLLSRSRILHVDRYNLVWMRGDGDDISIFNGKRSAFRLFH